MARADRRRAKRAKPNAALTSRTSSSAVEDTMFFPRLRRHAKWMFVALALVFGVGFVAFGIGAGGTGIGDILRDGGGGGDSLSVSGARKATQENPNDAQAWRDLSTAYQAEGDTDGAIVALNRYADLKPKDADALRELGGLYLTKGGEKQQEAQIAQLRAVYFGGSTQFAPELVVKGQTVGGDPIANALEQEAGKRVSELLSQARQSYADAVGTYRQLVAITPKDPSVQLELAQAAEQAFDTATAIQAYEEFLRLAPDDPNAELVKQQLKRLKQS